MNMADFIVTSATTQDNASVDIEIRDGTIDRIVSEGEGDPGAFDDDQHYDATGMFVTPPLIEPHIHLDAALTAGDPCWNNVGTLAAGIDIWEKRKQDLSPEGVKERASKIIEWLAANGVTRVRTHADVTEETLTGFESLLELREEVSDIVDLQVVAFPQDGVFTDEGNVDLLHEAIDMGADLVGGIPHNEYTREESVKEVETIAEIAQNHDLPIDVHIDETDDPNSRCTEILASEAFHRDIGKRTTASHTTALHSYPNAYADKVISLLTKSGVSVITNPPDNSVLQGRYDDYPRRRGHTRIDQLHDADVTVGVGHDSVMDPWNHYGKADPLDSAHLLIHYAQMNGYEDIETIWDMMTEANAEVLGAERYGLEEGNRGSLVLYRSPDAFNTLRTRAPRALVLRDGQPIAKTEPRQTVVERQSGRRTIDFHRD